MPKAPFVRKTKSARCMRASNDPTEAKEKRREYINKAIEVIQELQQNAEIIVRDCRQVLSECKGLGGREEIEILKRFNPTDEDEDWDGPYTIHFEEKMSNFQDYIELAERNDKKAGGE